MTAAAASQGTMDLLAGTQVLPVASIAADAIVLAGPLGTAAASLERFTLQVADGASRIRVPFRGSVGAGGGEVVVAPDDRGRVAAAAATTRRLDAEALRALVTPVDPHHGSAARRSRVTLLALAACALLAGYVGLRLWDKVTGIEPRVAWLATEVTTLLSPTSGRVTFVQPLGAVDAGQPAIGIETPSGKTLLLDAPAEVDLVAADKAVGERVKRGDPLLAYAHPDAPLYLHAVVDRDQAYRIAGGTRVRYARLDASAAPVVLDVAAADLHIRALPHDGRGQLYQVRIPVTAGSEQFRAMPVQMRFEQPPLAALAHALGAVALPPVGAGATGGSE